MALPQPVREIPAANVDQAVAYYVDHLGFTFDWGDDAAGVVRNEPVSLYGVRDGWLSITTRRIRLIRV